MKEAKLPAPVFNKKGIFVVILKRRQKTTQKTTQKTADKILEIIRSKHSVSKSEIAAILGGITEDGVKYHLNMLKKKAMIQRVGPDKGGYWQIIH